MKPSARPWAGISARCQKKAQERGKAEELRANEHPYRVEGEVGRFTFTTYRVERAGRAPYNTATAVFRQLKGEEWYKTSGFKEIGMLYGTTEMSYRKAAGLVNRIRYQDGATPVRSLRETTEAEGVKIGDVITRKTRAIFKDNNFTEEGIPRAPVKAGRQAAVFLSAEAIQQARAACGLSRQEQRAVESNPVEYEEPAHTVNISIDDVGVKKQKEERGAGSKSEPKAGKRQYAHNTIAHIQDQEKSYTINGGSIVSTLRIVIGFLLHNALLRYRLQFFVDGQKTLYAAIVRMFSWVSNIGIILDWYHLEEKCKIQLSLAMKGRHLRNETLEELMPLLWYGMVDQALHYLRVLKSEVIKNRAEVEVLIKYLERNRPYLPCYGVRKKLGLRNSSNIGEKMNDLVVSERQKHNGMSWSKGGSVALASVTALKRNHESQQWFEDGDVEFKFAA